MFGTESRGCVLRVTCGVSLVSREVYISRDPSYLCASAGCFQYGVVTLVVKKSSFGFGFGGSDFWFNFDFEI